VRDQVHLLTALEKFTKRHGVGMYVCPERPRVQIVSPSSESIPTTSLL